MWYAWGDGSGLHVWYALGDGGDLKNGMVVENVVLMCGMFGEMVVSSCVVC